MMFSMSAPTLIGLLICSFAHALGPAPIDLGNAKDFTILAKSGISTVPNSVITGNIGVSPASSTSLTGFSITRFAPGTFALSSQVAGQVYAADFTPPTPAQLMTAVSNMEAAYTDGAGRVRPDSLNLLGGGLTAQTLAPGLYKWTTDVTVTTRLTLQGSSSDVWIFQIAGNLVYAAGAQTILAGGAQPANIFWVVAGTVNLLAGSALDGVVLGAKNVALVTGAGVTGRILAQTAVTLQKATVKPN